MPALIAAYIIWGLFPVYWKFLVAFHPLELIGHRLLWTCLFCLCLIPLRGRWAGFAAAWRDRRTMLTALVAALLLSMNWLLFVWLIVHNRIVGVSLGYFLCPLVTVLLGWLVQGERPGRSQLVAMGCAASGVMVMVLAAGELPLAALGIALTWGCYGLIKKRTRLGPITGLGLECALLAPLALAGLVWWEWTGAGGLGVANWGANLLLASTGVVTAVPLLLFAQGARLVPLAMVGLLQYGVPSLNLLVGVGLYGETFDAPRVAAFACIWLGLAVYLTDTWHKYRRRRQA